MAKLYVINSERQKEPFSFQKVYNSARRAGASPKFAQEIAETIKSEAYPGIETSEIFRRINNLLKKESPKTAIRFNLKEAMRKLGPTGFPFEKYIGEVLKKFGYKVKINQYLPGKCVRSYEIDFVAQKEKVIFIGECKYRHISGEKVHSQDALANYARFLDIYNGPYFNVEKKEGFEIKSTMVTNAKFTDKALDYSNCVKIKLLGWKVPPKKGLEYLIESKNLYPITILPSLRGRLEEIFVSQKMMLASDVLKINPQKFAQKTKVSQKDIYSLIQEAEILLQ
jgi:uncharacterized protein YmfQ (DUF2313 family)